jgi:hypothetical protein
LLPLDWEHFQLIRRIEIAARTVHWSAGENGGNGDLVSDILVAYKLFSLPINFCF